MSRPSQAWPSWSKARAKLAEGLIRYGPSALVVAVIVFASIAVRDPGFTQGGFASHDVAGILYNGMVLDRGGLPYVDTLELKAPGTFYLARALAGAEARDIARFQFAANYWAVASLVCVALLGLRLWGRVAAIVGASLYALHDAVLDSMDANYVTWANLPQIAAFWLGIEASRARSSRAGPALWLLAGALAGFATLCKRPSGVVLLVLLVMAAWPGSGEGRRPSWARPVWVIAGFVLIHAPIGASYLAAGELGSLIDGYLLNRWGLRYVGARELGLLEGLGEGVLATAHFVGLPLVLAAFSLGAGGARWLRLRVKGREKAGEGTAGEETAGEGRELAFVALWLVGTLIAASVGFRFYKGYFLAVAAPMCLLAAAPVGLLGIRCRAHWLPRTLTLVLALVLVVRAGLALDRVREDRAQPHDLGGRAIASHLLANTEPGDTIWVWGWHLWDVYPLTGRMSASRIYKSLGILSQPNDDTWRRPASPLRFMPSLYADLLLADLERSRPAYVVLGSTVPHEEFEGLHEFLRRHYRRDYRVRLGRVQFWRLDGAR